MSGADKRLKALDAVFDAIREATAQEDWDRLQELDTSSRAHIGALVESAKAGELAVADVTDRLDRLQLLLESARSAAMRSRDEAQAALKNTGRTHQAAQAYLGNTTK